MTSVGRKLPWSSQACLLFVMNIIKYGLLFWHVLSRTVEASNSPQCEDLRPGTHCQVEPPRFMTRLIIFQLKWSAAQDSTLVTASGVSSKPPSPWAEIYQFLFLWRNIVRSNRICCNPALIGSHVYSWQPHQRSPFDAFCPSRTPVCYAPSKSTAAPLNFPGLFSKRNAIKGKRKLRACLCFFSALLKFNFWTEKQHLQSDINHFKDSRAKKQSLPDLEKMSHIAQNNFTYFRRMTFHVDGAKLLLRTRKTARLSIRFLKPVGKDICSRHTHPAGHLGRRTWSKLFSRKY